MEVMTILRTTATTTAKGKTAEHRLSRRRSRPPGTPPRRPRPDGPESPRPKVLENDIKALLAMPTAATFNDWRRTMICR
eukprot:3561216-Heterocapsa_arctica.AAC.1